MVNWWRSQTWESRAGIIGRGFAIAWLFIIPYSLAGASELHLPGFATAGLTEGVVGFMAVYVWFYLRGINGGTPAVWVTIASLLLLSIALGFVAGGTAGGFYGAAWLTGILYCATVAGCLRPRLALPTIAATAVVLAILMTLLGAPAAYTIVIVVETVLLGLSIVGVVWLAHTVGELRSAREELARLAVSEERLRFARDIHDLLGHSLSVIVLKSELLTRLLPEGSPARVEREAREIEAVARGALREVREAVAGYRKASLATELGGAAAAFEAAGIDYHRLQQGGAITPETEAVLAWAVREGVTNVIRHSQARRCSIRVERENGKIVLDVVDDGKGGKPSRGSGLRGVAERAAVIGGALEAGPLPHEGFRLRVTVPAG
ncbi:MAG: sensor histidine kinase [Candidatus Dormibacteraeota bacterium]|nr:sensor histidine kinase [Candidatus Dormibacteraeota bacterium]